VKKIIIYKPKQKETHRLSNSLTITPSGLVCVGADFLSEREN
jgi:hypothetical protein